MQAGVGPVTAGLSLLAFISRFPQKFQLLPLHSPSFLIKFIGVLLIHWCAVLPLFILPLSQPRAHLCQSGLQTTLLLPHDEDGTKVSIKMQGSRGIGKEPDSALMASELLRNSESEPSTAATIILDGEVFKKEVDELIGELLLSVSLEGVRVGVLLSSEQCYRMLSLLVSSIHNICCPGLQSLSIIR